MPPPTADNPEPKAPKVWPKAPADWEACPGFVIILASANNPNPIAAIGKACFMNLKTTIAL